MRRFLAFLEADQVGGVRHGGRYGDWLALEGATSLELIGTAYLAHSARSFAGVARLLGRTGAAAPRRGCPPAPRPDGPPPPGRSAGDASHVGVPAALPDRGRVARPRDTDR